MSKIYQIKVKDMYLAHPEVELVRKADTTRKFMGFFSQAPEKDQYRLVNCLYSADPVPINFDENLLEFLMGSLIAEFGEDQVSLYELAPIQLYPKAVSIEDVVVSENPPD